MGGLSVSGVLRVAFLIWHLSVSEQSCIWALPSCGLCDSRPGAQHFAPAKGVWHMRKSSFSMRGVLS